LLIQIGFKQIIIFDKIGGGNCLALNNDIVD
jgi:hypothetical protein